MNRQEYYDSLKGKQPRNMPKGNTRHGKRHTSIYWIWCTMKQRCTNPNNANYKNYGGRGITVCKRWISFANFLEDMGDRPSDKHSIERIDNDKGYSLDNCKWALGSEQATNRRPQTYTEQHRINIGIASKKAWARRKGTA